MDHYIIRIYRKEENNPGSFVGIVEEVETQGKRIFSTFEELWDILNRREKRKNRGVKGRGNRRERQ